MSAPTIPPIAEATPDGLALLLLDQRELPTREVFRRIESAAAAAEAIRSMQVRGAPAIGWVAALAVAVDLRRWRGENAGGTAEAMGRHFRRAVDVLRRSRPTGRNLDWALCRLEGVFEAEVGRGPDAAVSAVSAAAAAVADQERAMCRRIGDAGLEILPAGGATVLTHCNAGALATGGIGTATAPIYRAREQGRPVRVFATETRPVMQGARLTAWELERSGVDVTLIADSMAGALMAAGRVSLVIVGADAITMAGDAANKIGTYGLAVLARHHGIPFYVAAPRSTVDPRLERGRDVPIEERDPEEMRSVLGHPTAPPGVPVWNPAFDVTPASLITALITDGGVLRPPFRPALEDLLSS